MNDNTSPISKTTINNEDTEAHMAFRKGFIEPADDAVADTEGHASRPGR